MQIALLLAFCCVTAMRAQSVPAWHLVREATFSGGDNPAAELTDIRGIEVSRNGNVLVLDAKAQSIRVFAPDGRFLKNIGREGKGPGEFEAPNGFARAPDGRIWVDDGDNRRYTVLRDDGSYVTDVPSTLDFSAYVWRGYFDASGRLLNGIYVTNPKPSAVHGLDLTSTRLPMLERRSMTSNRADTLAYPSCWPPGVRRHGWSAQSSHGGIAMGVPFQSYESLSHSPDDFVWCAYGADYTIYKLRLGSGDTLQVIHGHATALPVTTAERDSVVDSAKALFVRSHADPGVISARDIPASKPIVIGLVIDDQGRLWVRLTPATPGHTRYDIYSAKGVEIGTIDLAAVFSEGPDVLIRGNTLYGVVHDEDEVPSVVRFRIEKP